MTTQKVPVPAHKTTAINPIIIIGALFFVFGFITWLNSVLIPYLKMACELNNVEAYLVTTAFYISYLVMGVPAALLLKKIGFKNGMSAGLVIMAAGALIFIPAALSRTYIVFLLGLFVQGTGLTVLQAAANPYVTIVGDRGSAAKRMSIMGICNKVAGVIAPIALGLGCFKRCRHPCKTHQRHGAGAKSTRIKQPGIKSNYSLCRNFSIAGGIGCSYLLFKPSSH